MTDVPTSSSIVISTFLSNAVEGLKSLLSSTTTPVWFTILTFAVGIVGTYYLLPQINQKFERQKIKTSFILKNLDELNEKTRALSALISKMSTHLITNEGMANDQRLEVSSRIAELQWKAIELGVVFEGQSALLLVERYQIALDELRISLNACRAPTDVDGLTLASKKFAEATLDVIREIVKVSGINVAVKSSEIARSFDQR